MKTETFEKVLSRFLSDQEISEHHSFFGQFGRTRRPEERMFYQKDGEPLTVKPQFFMTFNAVQSLIYLQAIARKASEFRSSLPQDALQIVERYSDRIEQSLIRAGDFAERLLVKHGGRIVMQDEFYHRGSFISYRHTIGAALILLLCSRQARLVENILAWLMDSDAQNGDGGWPIADRIYPHSDLLCSSHAAFLFDLALQREQFSGMTQLISSKLEATVAYLVIENHKNSGYWIYENEADRVPFTARTYPELSRILHRYHLSLAVSVPEKLLDHYPVDRAAHFAGIQSFDQLEIRLAYVFRLAAHLRPVPFLEKYLQARNDVVENYSNDIYYSTYELCCLITMMLDQVQLSASGKARMVFEAAEPVLMEIPFVGKTYTITKEVYGRLKKMGLL